MEGRIRREDITAPPPAARSTEPRPAAPQSRYGGYSGRRTSAYRKRRGNSRGELIPEGRDLFMVQFLASGVLLLFVMFVSIVDTEATVSVRQKLRAAIVKSTTAEEFAQAAASVKDGIAGRAGTVFEIFGGELDDSKRGGAETEDLSQAADAPANTDISTQNVFAEGVLIDPETLKQLNESSEEDLKN